ncbi:hypothetical protein BJ165DRAFT_179778 [Panaeolus papilionaceus]|nr:hypothetical protein BJ165DRAFT_179778 [Panaeolus papilionaceus]
MRIGGDQSVNVQATLASLLVPPQVFDDNLKVLLLYNVYQRHQFCNSSSHSLTHVHAPSTLKHRRHDIISYLISSRLFHAFCFRLTTSTPTPTSYQLYHTHSLLIAFLLFTSIIPRLSYAQQWTVH